MVVEYTRPSGLVAEAFIAIAHRMVWCSLATVDRRGRPRARLVHPIWELHRRRPRRLARVPPLRRCARHLAATPFVPRTTSRSRVRRRLRRRVVKTPRVGGLRREPRRLEPATTPGHDAGLTVPGARAAEPRPSPATAAARLLAAGEGSQVWLRS